MMTETVAIGGIVSAQDLMIGFPPPADRQVTLENWRLPPFNSWAFHHVREILPTANIAHQAGGASPLSRQERQLGEIAFRGPDQQDWTVARMLTASSTDGLVVLKSGRVAAEQYFNGQTADAPHIVFSVSKSITGTLAGILVEQGQLDPDAPVIKYIPEAVSSAYGDCTVRHVLDMTVSIDFVEDYLNADGPFARYRMATGWNPIYDKARLNDLRSFLLTLPRDKHPHGERFYYVSPNSDMLGWILERAASKPYATLLSELIWKKMGAEDDAYITVDRLGAPRTAGGICTTARDLARFGDLMRCGGMAAGKRVVPAAWVEDILRNGDRAAWERGASAQFLPQGRYRSKWYMIGNAHGAYCAIGIHGQWIYVDPAAEVVIAKVSSQPLPVDEAIDRLLLTGFDAIARALAG